MKTILKVMMALLIASAAAFGVYLLKEKHETRYVNIYTNYKEEDE